MPFVDVVGNMNEPPLQIAGNWVKDGVTAGVTVIFTFEENEEHPLLLVIPIEYCPF